VEGGEGDSEEELNSEEDRYEDGGGGGNAREGSQEGGIGQTVFGVGDEEGSAELPANG